VLGDNIFYGYGLVMVVRRAAEKRSKRCLFGYWVRHPSQYGVIDSAPDGSVREIVEKPLVPLSIMLLLDSTSTTKRSPTSLSR
jgi:glucose-1-phosphate thymidylyltransferase